MDGDDVAATSPPAGALVVATAGVLVGLDVTAEIVVRLDVAAEVVVELEVTAEVVVDAVTGLDIGVEDSDTEEAKSGT